MRSNLSSAALGRGLFNWASRATASSVWNPPVPRRSWGDHSEQRCSEGGRQHGHRLGGSLDFTVERSGKSLIGSAASGEGLVNVYRGTGKVLLAPVTKGIA